MLRNKLNQAYSVGWYLRVRGGCRASVKVCALRCANLVTYRKDGQIYKNRI